METKTFVLATFSAPDPKGMLGSTVNQKETREDIWEEGKIDWIRKQTISAGHVLGGGIDSELGGKVKRGPESISVSRKRCSSKFSLRNQRGIAWGKLHKGEKKGGF